MRGGGRTPFPNQECDSPMQTRPRFHGLLGLSLALCAGAALAEPSPKEAVDPAPVTVPAAAGQVPLNDTANDAALEATAADLAAMKAAAPIAVRDDGALAVTVQADGTQSAVLDDSFLSTTVARVGPDGRLIFGCVTSRPEYDAFFAEKAAPSTPEVR